MVTLVLCFSFFFLLFSFEVSVEAIGSTFYASLNNLLFFLFLCFSFYFVSLQSVFSFF